MALVACDSQTRLSARGKTSIAEKYLWAFGRFTQGREAVT
jgi:hypothetical protein